MALVNFGFVCMFRFLLDFSQAEHSRFTTQFKYIFLTYFFKIKLKQNSVFQNKQYIKKGSKHEKHLIYFSQ